MSYTMEQFKETITEVNKLREKEKLMVERFEKSTCELAGCFHWILKSALEGENHCCLTVDTCPELYAKELEGMGFMIEEQRNAFNALCGYDISW